MYGQNFDAIRVGCNLFIDIFHNNIKECCCRQGRHSGYNTTRLIQAQPIGQRTFDKRPKTIGGFTVYADAIAIIRPLSSMRKVAGSAQLQERRRIDANSPPGLPHSAAPSDIIKILSCGEPCPASVCIDSRGGAINSQSSVSYMLRIGNTNAVHVV